MRDDPRKPSPDTSSSPEPAQARPASRERHPALRPRLGDGQGGIREEELSAFSSKPHNPTPGEAAAAPDAAAAQAPGARPRPKSRPGEAPQGSGGSGGAAEGAAGAGTTRKMVRKQRAPRSAGAQLKRFTLLVLLPCALAGGAGWAMTSPRLAVSGVDVAGVDSTPEALVQPISQALTGQNWLRADMAAARSRLAKLPTVEFASVSRAWNHWPPRLSVRIQERRPWLRLGGGGSWWIVDRAGVTFRRATREDRELYAITSTAFDPEALRVGQKVPAPIWDGVRRLGQALDESSRQGGPWQIKRAYLDRDGMASLRLRGGSQDGLLVRLGDGLWPQKMERARRALLFFEAAGRRAQSLNLVSFSMPTWTPLQPRSAASQASPNTRPGASAPSHEQAGDATTTAPTTAPTTPTDTINTATDTAAERADEAAPSTSGGQERAPEAAEPAQAKPSATGNAENQAADGSDGSNSHGAGNRGVDGAGATA